MADLPSSVSRRPFGSKRRAALSLVALTCAATLALQSPPDAGATSHDGTRAVNAPEARSAAVTGHTSLLVVLAKVNGHRDTMTRAKARSAAGTVASWTYTTSGARFSVRTQATKWLGLRTRVRCGAYEKVFQAAFRAAKRRGYRPGRYGRVAVYMPHCRRVPWAGLAEGDRSVWLNGSRDGTTSVLAHEFLHTLGLLHAGSIECRSGGAPVSLTLDPFKDCVGEQYGDYYDIMGSSFALRLTAMNRMRLGWMPSTQMRTLSSGTSTVTLRPPGASGDGYRLLTLVTGTVRYWVELDPQDGVMVRTNQFPAFGATSALIDVDPVECSNFDGFDIPVGQSWTAPKNLRITVLSQAAGTAQVRVTFAAPSPTPPGAPPAPTLDTTDPSLPVLTINGSPGDGGMVVCGYQTEFDYGDHATVMNLDEVDPQHPNSPTTIYQAGGAPVRARVRARSEVGVGAWSDWSS